MMKTKIAPFLLILIYSIIVGCEKDDICLIETPSTPQLVVRLFDKDNRNEYKAANNIIVYGVGNKDPLMTINSDSLALPLKVQSAFTQYAFVLPSSTVSSTVSDTLQFNYGRFDEYINRACGYRANFTLNENVISYPINAPLWIESFEILIDTVSNEQQAHLAIYH